MKNQIIIEFDAVNGHLRYQGKQTKIDPILARLLDYFLDNPDVVINRQSITENVWQSGYVSNEAINRSISLLRSALGQERDTFIKTIPKKGYLFNIPSGLIIHRNHLDSTSSILDDIPIKTVKGEIIHIL